MAVAGAPTGDVTTTGAVRAVDELRFAPSADGVTETAVIKQMSGGLSMPTMSMPIDLGEQAPVEFTMGPAGVDPAELTRARASLGMPSPGVDVYARVGSSMAAARLVALPGRTLSIGESWVDTVRLSPEDAQFLEGFAIEMLMTTRGTYAGDTVVDGRLLNILRIASETTAKGSGTLQGVEFRQEMTTTSEATVLWDSALHIPRFSDAVARTQAESVVPAQGATVLIDGRSRSITTAEVAR